MTMNLWSGGTKSVRCERIPPSRTHVHHDRVEECKEMCVVDDRHESGLNIDTMVTRLLQLFMWVSVRYI